MRDDAASSLSTPGDSRTAPTALSTRLAVVNDDLTGCNVTGSLFVGRGLKALSLVDPHEIWLRRSPADVVLMVNSDSRTLPPAAAYARVQAVGRQVEAAGIRLLGKRIDSALRGNLGAEIDAVLDLRAPASLAIVVPSVPADGRTMVGGEMRFGGVPLDRADVAGAPGVPATSDVPAIVAGQTRRPVGRIDLGDVAAGPAAVAARLREEAGLGNRVVVVDCVTAADAEAIAEGVLQSGLDILAADAGPISAELAYRLIRPPARREDGENGGRGDLLCPSPRPAISPSPIFVVVGSRSPLTAAQVAEARQMLATNLVEVDAEDLLVGDEVGAAVVERAVRQVLSSGEGLDAVGVVVSLPEGSRPVARAADRPAVATGLAGIARSVLVGERIPVGGLFLSGGDTAVEACRALGIEGIEVRGQVAILQPYGHVVGGPLAGLPVVTKGGTVGGRTAIVESIRFLQQSARRQAGG